MCLPSHPSLQAPALQERHREAILRVLDHPDLTPAEATLRDLLDADLHKHLAELREITRAAQGEAGIDSFLASLAEAWEGLRWDVAAHQLPPAQQQAQAARPGSLQVSLLQPAPASPLAAPRPVIRGWDVILATVDDHLASLASMRLSPFFAPFAGRADAWVRRLTELRTLVDAWLDVQRAWLHMVSLFGGPAGDIRQQLPREYDRLVAADDELRRVMARVAAAPQVLAAVSISTTAPLASLVSVRGGGGSFWAATPARGPPETPTPARRASTAPRRGSADLPHHFGARRADGPVIFDAASLLSLPSGNLAAAVARAGEALGRVQAGLSDFLEAQRVAFPRFYFLGDDDLLELLGSGAGAAGAGGIQRHLPRLFAGVASLRMAGDSDGGSCEGNGPAAAAAAVAVLALVSPEGEQLPLLDPVPVPPAAPLHEWLAAVTAGMQAALLAAVVASAAELTPAPAAAGIAGLGGNAAASHAATALLSTMDKRGVGAALLAARVRWTAEVEQALGASAAAASPAAALAAIEAAVSATLQALTGRGDHIESAEGAGSGGASLARRKAEAAIIDLVHRRDVTRALGEHLSASKADMHGPPGAATRGGHGAGLSRHDFEWTSRLRAYILPGGGDAVTPAPASIDGPARPPQQLQLSIGQAAFAHGLEYLGVGERLVQVRRSRMGKGGRDELPRAGCGNRRWGREGKTSCLVQVRRATPPIEPVVPVSAPNCTPDACPLRRRH